MTDQQNLFLNYFFDRDSDYRGDHVGAGIAAGYSRDYIPQLMKLLRDEIRQRTVDSLSANAPKAVQTMELAMDDDGSTPKGELRLKAAEGVLDRMGVGKQQAIDITSKDESISPLFFLPAKDDVEVDPEHDNIKL